MLWSTRNYTSEVYEFILENKISCKDKILDLGCGEGRDSIFFLAKGYNILAVDYSKTVMINVTI